ncbi:MAG: HAD family hydrolase [Halobacteriales archaeon]|nr:HAD family hydrolase [Halobacteriales archaeon]
MRYDAVVFDADGVLVEPTATATLRRAIRRAFADHGVADPAEDAVDGLQATTTEELRSIAERYGLDDPAAFWASRDDHASAAQREAVRAGEKILYDDVDAALALPVPLAIVSNNQQATVDFVVEQAGLGDHFAPVFGRQPTLEDITRKKPEPHYLQRAIDDLGAERPLFVGDSNVDLAAAAAAGVDSAFIRRPHRADYVLDHEPTYVIESLDELAGIVAADAPARTDD